MPPVKRVVVSWSSGKDAAWMLHVLRQQVDVDVVALLTTINESADRVSMHAVRRSLVEAQADAAGLPLWPVMLPWPCSNEDYERLMSRAIDRAREAGATHVAFGDLHLDDVRAYREDQMAGTELQPLFPLWHPRGGTAALAREMVAGGLRATLTCVDPKQLDPSYLGCTYDHAFVESLPESCDPCGENGEFHTFCHAGPMFARDIAIELGESRHQDGFWFADIVSASA